MSHRIAAVLITAAAVWGLTACTSSPTAPASTPTSHSSDQPGDDGQSTADACAIIQQSIQDATVEFENAATTDPATAAQAMISAAEHLADRAAQVTNDEVAALLPGLQEMFAAVGETMNAIVAGDASRAGELSQLGTDLRVTSEAFQEVCGS